MSDVKAPARITFQPLNDQVLVKLDVKEASALSVQSRPTVLPSGVVIATGRGTYIPGSGFVETQVKPGDHVALSKTGEWTRLPLSTDPNEIFVAVSEFVLLGKLTDAGAQSPWFKSFDLDGLLN